MRDAGALDRYEETVRRLAAATRSATLYSATHPLVQRGVTAFTEACATLLVDSPSLTVAFMGSDVVVNGVRLARSAAPLHPFAAGLQERCIERVTIERGVTTEDIRGTLEVLAGSSSDQEVASQMNARGVRHVSVGMIGLSNRKSRDTGLTVARRLYNASVESAGDLWEAAKANGQADLSAARSIIASLSGLMTEDRTALMALTALKKHDSYTFTHMVNVSVLTMALARSLALDSKLVNEFGFAALLHDIGKVQTPIEILNKPDRLTPRESEVMKRHVVDGAHILRRTPEVPRLAPLVAFEHHLRFDLSGYPENIIPRPLNLCTMIVGIADVFDALRSHRPYRDGLATVRVRAILEGERRRTFHPTLLERFVTLVGLYPVGHLVRLSTEDLGVVVEEHPSDPFRPKVKIIMDRTAARLPEPILVDTSERNELGEYLRNVIEPIDPEVIGTDPLTVL